MPAPCVAALRRLCFSLLVLVVLGLVGVPALAAAEDIAARRYDVRLTVLPDGSVDVVETIRLSAGAKPMTWFERSIPARGTDGLQLTRVTLDGVGLSGERDGQGLRVRGRRDLDLRVTFAPTVNADRVIVIEYRARHVVAMDEGRPRLRWTALPARHDYPIQRSTILVSAPAGAEAREVRAVGGQMGTGADGGLSVTASALGRTDTVTLDLIFVPGTLVPADPIWFRDQERARQLVPAFVSGFLVLLVIGAGVLVMIFTQDRVRRSPPDAAAAGEPVDPALAPALASLLVANGRGRQWLSLQAAFFGLVYRGAISITQNGPGAWWRPASFDVVAGGAGAAWSHEQWLIDALAAHGNHIDLRRFTRSAFRRQRHFHARLADDARTLGWMDPEREKTASGLQTTGLLLVFSAVASLLLVGMRLGHLGVAAQLVPAGLFADGLMFVVASAVMGRLSARGERAAIAWRARAALMKATARRRGGAGAGEPADANAVGQWLPFAVDIGIGRAWVKAHAAVLASGEAAWLRAFGGAAGSHAALLAVISASGAAHAGGNGVMGAGGAGGGASSAG